MGTSRYETVCATLLEIAQKVGLPTLDELRQLLAKDKPADQFKALQEAVTLLVEHTKKDGLLFDGTPLFKETCPADKPEKAQKDFLNKAIRNWLPPLLKVLENQEQPAKDTKDPLADLQPNQARLVKFGPKLRYRLWHASLGTACKALDPPVDVEGFPYDEKTALALFKEVGEEEFTRRFADLERAATHFLACPKLDNARAFSESLADVRGRHLAIEFLSYCPVEAKPLLQQLLAISHDYARLKKLMADDKFTVALVSDGLKGYSRLIAEGAPRHHERHREPEPAPAGEGGGVPRLPLRRPARNVGDTDRPEREDDRAETRPGTEGNGPSRPASPPRQDDGRDRPPQQQPGGRGAGETRQLKPSPLNIHRALGLIAELGEKKADHRLLKPHALIEEDLQRFSDDQLVELMGSLEEAIDEVSAAAGAPAATAAQAQPQATAQAAATTVQKTVRQQLQALLSGFWLYVVGAVVAIALVLILWFTVNRFSGRTEASGTEESRPVAIERGTEQKDRSGSINERLRQQLKDINTFENQE